MSRREDLERVLEVLWLAFDGGRTLQGRVKDGEEMSFREPAAPLAREIRAVTKELAELMPAEGKSAADEIAARREARRSDAADSAPASRRGQSRRRGGSNRAG